MQPKLIVCLGRIAAMRLIRKDFRISREHGQWEQRGGIWFTAMYHPAALLRDDAKKPQTFYDLEVPAVPAVQGLPRNLRRQGHRAALIIWIAEKSA